MPQLDPTWFASQLFWLAITFVMLYVVLSRVILPPLMGIMAERKGTIEGDLASAQTFKTEAEEAKALYERTLAEARARSQQLLDDAMLAHKQRAEQSGKEMDWQIAKTVSDAESKISTKKRELMDALSPAAAELAEVIVAKLVQHTSGNSKSKPDASTFTKTNR